MATDAVPAERASIDAAVEGQTICHILARNVDLYGGRPALSWKQGHAWRSLTWRGYRDQVARIAMGLRTIGVGRGDVVAIMARNRPEHLIADLGAVHAGATPVSLYNTLAPEQIAYIAGHCEAKVAVIESRDFVERWEKVKADLPALERVVLLQDAPDVADLDWALSWEDLAARGDGVLVAEPRAFEDRWKRVQPDDTVTLVYTSGTTGPPKAVLLTHRNMLWTAESLDRTGTYPTGMRTMSYLPLAHVLERLVSHYVSMYKAAHVHCCPDVRQVFELAREVRPEAFAGVPRVWEKLQAGVLAGLHEEPNERKRKIALRAIDIGRRAVRLEQAGRPVPIGVRAQRALFEKLVYSKIRERIGMDRCALAVSAAAPIAPDVLEFFWGIGLPVIEGYGMTEDSGPAAIGGEGRGGIGTVGKALPGVELELAEDGELLVRGGNVAPGYYRDPERTAETFDPDGWLHTGDIARLRPDGSVMIVDRKKELLITAGGKNVSPANLESLLKRHPLIGQACVVGDRRPYVSALVVLDGEVAPGWAERAGLRFTTLAEFARAPRVVAEIQEAVDDANQHLSRVEQIRRFVILGVEWTVDSEELTPTLKVKRRVVLEKYADEIESLYAGERS